MHNVGLLGAPFERIEEVVGWLGAVQAQDYGPAKWSIGHRMRGALDSELGEALCRGTILRTHVLRTTWHFVTRKDIRWMLELTGPRIIATSRGRLRQLDLNDAALRKSGRAIERILKTEGQVTRRQLRASLEKSGVATDGQRFAWMVMHAELSGLVCSGALDGKQQTYALLEQRAPKARSLPRDKALAELVRRYFRSHGPATIKDMSWWSSLTVADIRAGLEMVEGELQSEVVDGATFWWADARGGRKPATPRVHLLQPYDEYIVGYSKSKWLLNIGKAAVPEGRERSLFSGVVMLDGQLAGHWKRHLKKGAVEIRVALYAPFSKSQMKALEAQAKAHGRFLQLDSTVHTTHILD